MGNTCFLRRRRKKRQASHHVSSRGFSRVCSPQTIERYERSLLCLAKTIGDRNIEELTKKDFVAFRKELQGRGVGYSYICGVTYALRSLISYCNSYLDIRTIKPTCFRPPKRPRRDVIYLTKEEIDKSVGVIDTNTWNGLRFRTLVEVLLGTGMRIGEALSLKRKDIDWVNKEARIIGKGDKKRSIFFFKKITRVATKYLESRTDDHSAVFVTRRPVNELDRNEVWRFFGRAQKLAKIEKKVTPHTLRHTVATNLVFNGCPLVHVKEILGHERLDTTCRYYLGIDNVKAKKAPLNMQSFTDFTERVSVVYIWKSGTDLFICLFIRFTGPARLRVP